MGPQRRRDLTGARAASSTRLVPFSGSGSGHVPSGTLRYGKILTSSICPFLFVVVYFYLKCGWSVRPPLLAHHHNENYGRRRGSVDPESSIYDTVVSQEQILINRALRVPHPNTEQRTCTRAPVPGCSFSFAPA